MCFFSFSLFFRFYVVRWIKLAIASAFERTQIYRIVSFVGVGNQLTYATLFHYLLNEAYNINLSDAVTLIATHDGDGAFPADLQVT